MVVTGAILIFAGVCRDEYEPDARIRAQASDSAAPQIPALGQDGQECKQEMFRPVHARQLLTCQSALVCVLTIRAQREAPMYANKAQRPQQLTKRHTDQVRRDFLNRMRAARERSYELLRQRLRATAGLSFPFMA